MAEKSKNHGGYMYQIGDEEHLKAMNEMQELMKSTEAMKECFESKKKKFDALTENE